ncbi:hypothetical protein R0135_03780 [Congregibacter variabilis]|uniref:Uncharacterized protein n=1 Tax=Congregibacter variabilis TaxID=3081200 RepID=A0ABZ0I436_9GAMM|nr:hypothetical protein R0135_03780 [Congregibacter sp. IMCC43200]
MQNLVSRASWLCVALLCASLSIIAMRWTVGALELQVVKAELKKITALRAVPDLSMVAERLDSAARRQPLNADFYGAQGFVRSLVTTAPESLRYTTTPDLPDAASAARVYRKALIARPHSGHLWALYAEALYASEGATDTLRHALERCATLAPLQHAVIVRELVIMRQMTLSDIALRPAEQNRLRELLTLLAARSKKQLSAIIGSPETAASLLKYTADPDIATWLQDRASVVQ